MAHCAFSETSCCLHSYWSKRHVHLLISDCWMAGIHFLVSSPFFWFFVVFSSSFPLSNSLACYGHSYSSPILHTSCFSFSCPSPTFLSFPHRRRYFSLLFSPKYSFSPLDLTNNYFIIPFAFITLIPSKVFCLFVCL